jgi:RecQ-mediated genome instability protein 1
MSPPVEVLRWLNEAYQKPRIAPKWLSECYEWIIDTHGLSPANDLLGILDHIEMQFLNSDLRDSALPGTGFPADISTWQRDHLRGPGVLVEVISLTEIGHSAFSLLQAREKRIEKESVVGLEDLDGVLPKYPRGTLRFELTDGTMTIPAIEYRPLPELELGEIPLGYKVGIRVQHFTYLFVLFFF